MPPSPHNTTAPPRRTPGLRLLDFACSAVTWLHLRLARLLSGLIGRCWRLQARLPLGLRFAIAALGLALGAVLVAYTLPVRFALHLNLSDAHIRQLTLDGLWHGALRLTRYAWGVAALSLLAALFALWRRRFSLHLLQAAWAAAALLFTAVVRWLLVVPAVLHNADYRSFDKLARNDLWTQVFLLSPLVALWPLLMLLALLLAGTRRHYTGRSGLPLGERLLANLRTGGTDRRLRSSIYWATFLTLLVIVGPILIRGCGREEYGLVKGSGEVEVQVVKIKKKPQKQKQKKLTINPWSPYILERMNIDDIKTLAELEEQTRDTYEADQTSGKLGKGGKGRGGWPKGMEGAKIRFIRLKYAGGDWDRDMGKGADYNLLVRLNQYTGLPIATDTEYRDIERLARFPKKRAPPFVFITGSRGLSITPREAKILREYCELEGGMLFIDNGGGYFGRSVRQMLLQVFPNRTLVDIANDDPIYQAPFMFPDGAPPLWHHDGNRALGIRHEGRWLVFYHPGDINDAWKDGHSGASAQVADQAYKMGVNVIYYAFNQYYRRHYEQE